MSDLSHMRRKDKLALNDLSPERRGLLQVVERRGEDLANLSKRMGRNHAYLLQFIWRGVPRKLDEDDRKKLADLLEIDEKTLRPGASPELKSIDEFNNSKDVATPNHQSLEYVRDGHLRFLGPRDLPILGYAKAGELGFFIVNGERQGVTVRPEALRDVAGAYAVRVHDESMSPVLEAGYLLFVDPTRPTKPGDNVVIQMNDGQAFIKRLVRRTEKATICKQFNPGGEVKFDPAKIRSVHLVVQISTIDI